MLDYNYNYFEKQDLDLEGEEPDIQKKITHFLRQHQKSPKKCFFETLYFITKEVLLNLG